MSKPKPDLSKVTFAEFTENEYLGPKLASETINSGTARLIRSLNRRFLTFAGSEISCAEVNAALLEKYRSWLEGRGYSRKSVNSYIECVRRIVRAYNPQQLAPRRPDKGAKFEFIDADQEGSLEEVCLKRYLPQNPKTSSAQSLRMYGLALRYFGEFLGRPAMLADLTDETVGAYQRWLVAAHVNDPITAVGYVKRISALWTWCAKKRIVSEFPTFGRLPVPKVIPTCWMEPELRQLFAACQKQRGHFGKIKASAFWTAFHLLLWDSGERTGAMLQLRWEHLDLRTGDLVVPAEVRKNAKPAHYRLKQPTLNALRAIRRPQRELIFEVGHVNSFHNYYNKLIRSAGLTYVKSKTGPQKMRRTFASFIEAAGGNATKALKHTDRRVTEDSYLDPRVCETTQENEKLFPLN